MFPIDFFWRAAERWPENIAIEGPEGAVSYRDLAGRVAALAAGLQAHDPEVQTRVGICAGTSVDHVTALLAVLACGKTWIPLNPKSTQREIRRVVDATEPSILILDSVNSDLLQGVSAKRIYLGTGSSLTASALIAENMGAPPKPLTLDRDATQAIKFTGGTTGLPKGVKQTYRAWLASIVNQISVWEFDQHDRYVVAAPITHGTSTYLLPILAQGGRHVLPRQSGSEGVKEAFRDAGGTVCFMPPTLIYMLMAQGTKADFKTLRRLIYGGSPMPVEKIRAAREFFGPVLCTTYGQTEAPQILTAMRPEDFEDPGNWGAVGRATWFNDVQIAGPDGRLLPRGEVGEVVARGDLVMSGYWKLPDETAKTLRDGWLHTGDRGLIDRRGFLYLKDRLKDVVITGGFNVYPTDVESVLSEHAAVHESSVFGVPDDKWVEAVHAAVQLRPGANVSEKDLIAFVRERLGPVQTPKRIHFFEALPTSPVGKVLKTKVKESVLAQLELTATSIAPETEKE
jgi:acyl-CoA synthetase (AMP-forming)/AMP-acid ligase II